MNRGRWYTEIRLGPCGPEVVQFWEPLTVACVVPVYAAEQTFVRAGRWTTYTDDYRDHPRVMRGGRR